MNNKMKLYYIEQYQKETTKKAIELMHTNTRTSIKDILDQAAKNVRDMKDPDKTPGFYLIHYPDNPLTEWKKHLTFEAPTTENEKEITQILEGFTKK